MVTMSTNSNVIVAIILGGNVIVAVPHASSASAFVGRSASAFAWSATRRVAGFWHPRSQETRHVAGLGIAATLRGPRSLRRIVVGVLPAAALAFTSVRLRRHVVAGFPIVDSLFEVLPGCLRCCHPRFSLSACSEAPTFSHRRPCLSARPLLKLSKYPFMHALQQKQSHTSGIV